MGDPERSQELKCTRSDRREEVAVEQEGARAERVSEECQRTVDRFVRLDQGSSSVIADQNVQKKILRFLIVKLAAVFCCVKSVKALSTDLFDFVKIKSVSKCAEKNCAFFGIFFVRKKVYFWCFFASLKNQY